MPYFSSHRYHHLPDERRLEIAQQIVSGAGLLHEVVLQHQGCPEHKDERSQQAFRYPLGARVISLLNLPYSICR